MNESADPRRGGCRSYPTVSLAALFFATFVCACLSLWLADFGPGLAVALGWCVVIGAATGVLTGALLIFAQMIWRHRSDSTSAVLAQEMYLSTAAGTVGGITAAAVGFAMLAPSNLVRVEMNGQWFEAVVRRGADGLQTSREFPAFLFMPAAAGAIACASAAECRRLRRRPAPYVVATAVSSGAIAGTAVLAAVAISFATLARPASPPEGFHENMSGLMPLALPVWCGIAALMEGMLGAAAAGLWLFEWRTRSRRGYRIVFWFAVLLFAVILTELGLRH